MRWWEALPGPLLGRYRVERLLGQGGMAEVLLARDERFDDRRVAIKAPTLDSFAANQMEELLLRFRREVQRQGSEPIAGVVSIIDAGEVTDARGNSQPFLVMDYLSGGSLGDKLGGSSGRRERTLTLGEVLEWLRPVATTLDRLHARKYLHRDVKPDNILFNADGDPFLSDFGIATSLEDVAGAGTMMSVMGSAGPGSPGYQSPESLRGDKLAASDQFSLAVTAYEALAGRLPMNASTRDGWIGALANWKPVPISEACPELPSAAAEVLMRALSLEPRDRYLSCTAFAQALVESVAPFRSGAAAPALETARAAAPVAATPVAPAPDERAQPASRRSTRARNILVGVLLGGTMLLGGIVALGLWLDQPETPAGDDDNSVELALPEQASSAAPSQEASPSSATQSSPTPEVVATDGSIVGDLSTDTLARAALALQARYRKFLLASEIAAVDAENASYRVSGDESRRKALASSLAAAQQGRAAARLAASLAEFTGSYMDVSSERGGSLLMYASDIVERSIEFARKPPYAVRNLSAMSPNLPLDAGFAQILNDTRDAKARVQTVIGHQDAGPLAPEAGPESGNDFRRKLGGGAPFTTDYEEIRPSGTSPMLLADRCSSRMRLGGTVDSPTGPLRAKLTSTCNNTDRQLDNRDEFTIVEPLSRDLMEFRATSTAQACKREDSSPCPGFEATALRERSGEMELITDDLLFISMGSGKKGGGVLYFLLSRKSDPAIEDASAP